MQVTTRPTTQRTNREVVAEAITRLTAPQTAIAAEPAFAALRGPSTAPNGVRGARPADSALFAGFTERTLTIERQREAGDRVITHVTFRGRHTRDYRGVAPTGREMEARGVLVHDVCGGSVIDAWSVLQWRSVEATRR